MSRHLRVLLDAGVVVDERVADRRSGASVPAAARTRSSRSRRGSTRSRRTGTNNSRRSNSTSRGKVHVTEARPVRSELPRRRAAVEVDVDPQTAFVAFTDEMDHWWMRSPISYYDRARAIARRCEHGVGGRLLEVYDDATGDVLVLGRITEWEPGAGCSGRARSTTSRSTCDSSPSRHRHERAGRRARAARRGSERRPAASRSCGTVPDWFVKWCARRDTASREIRDLSRLNLVLYYRKPVTAARWLAARVRVRTAPAPAESARTRTGSSSTSATVR